MADGLNRKPTERSWSMAECGFKFNTEAFVRQSGGSKELLVPVKFNNGVAEIVEEIRW